MVKSVIVVVIVCKGFVPQAVNDGGEAAAGVVGVSLEGFVWKTQLKEFAKCRGQTLLQRFLPGQGLTPVWFVVWIDFFCNPVQIIVLPGKKVSSPISSRVFPIIIVCIFHIFGTRIQDFF